MSGCHVDKGPLLGGRQRSTECDTQSQRLRPARGAPRPAAAAAAERPGAEWTQRSDRPGDPSAAPVVAGQDLLDGDLRERRPLLVGEHEVAGLGRGFADRRRYVDRHPGRAADAGEQQLHLPEHRRRGHVRRPGRKLLGKCVGSGHETIVPAADQNSHLRPPVGPAT